MTAPLSRTATHLDDLAVHLGGWGSVDPGAAVFGADLPGCLGALGRELHGRWATEVSERSGTAAALAGRLTETAATLRTAGGGYTSTEGDAARRTTQAGES